MKKMNFTKKMMFTLLAGLLVGLGVIFIREQLMGSGQEALWTQINNFFFVDITQEGSEKAVGLFFIIGQVFLRGLQMVLIPLIFTSIVKAIGQIRDVQLLNKLAKKSFATFLTISGIAILLATVVGLIAYNTGIFQMTGVDITGVASETVGKNPLMLILDAVNPNIIQTLGNNGSILAVVVLALLVGVGIQKLGDKIEFLPKAINEIHELTMMFMTWIIINVSPIAIFALLVRTFAAYGIQYLRPALIYMALTSITLLVALYVVYPLIIWVKTKKSPMPFIKKVSKVAIFGFSTSSSAATLPLSQETVINELGVDETVASFVVPIGCSLNKSGTAIMQVIATLFIASVAGYPVGVVEMISIMLLAFIGSVSTPAAPGAGAILLFTIISGMGYSNPVALAAYSFILAINRPVEMLVTAVNVSDDSVSSILIASSLDAMDDEVYMSETVKSDKVVVAGKEKAKQKA